ncbi:MAG: flagellar motor switch protein FliM [Chloroflexi bacterium]|nr:flagellar motor switch protein FliM [Chloroflexota bacterium]
MEPEGKTDTEAKKVLSQWEIDLLLGAMGNQEGQESTSTPESNKSVRPYDFRRPDKFSKEHLRALQTIHEAFARAAAFSLSSHMRTGIQIKLSSIEQAVYGEYVQQLSNPTVVSIASADPLPGRLIIEINMDLAFAIVDRLLGGTGQFQQKLREVTDIEFALLQTVVKSLLAALREAWLHLAPVTVGLEDLVFNPQIVQAAFPSDIGILLLFELRIGEASSTISMYIPYTLLEPVMGKLSSQMWFSRVRKEASEDRDTICRQIETIELPITVNLGSAIASTRELLDLHKGDVIKLSALCDQELRVLVADKHKFWSRPGRVGRRMAVAITRSCADNSLGGDRYDG